jgi:hypothetical protein
MGVWEYRAICSTVEHIGLKEAYDKTLEEIGHYLAACESTDPNSFLSSANRSAFELPSDGIFDPPPAPPSSADTMRARPEKWHAALL